MVFARIDREGRAGRSASAVVVEGMRNTFLLILALTGLAALTPRTASAAVPGDNFYGKYQWRAIGDQEWYDNPRDACVQGIEDPECRQWIAQRRVRQRPRSGRRRLLVSASYDENNEYDCKWQHPNAANTAQVHETTENIVAEYKCPSNANSYTRNNSGLAKDMRCKCNGPGSCFTARPAPYDTTSRCLGLTSAKLEVGPVTSPRGGGCPRCSSSSNSYAATRRGLLPECDAVPSGPHRRLDDQEHRQAVRLSRG